MYLNQYWKDERLAFSVFSNEEEILDADYTPMNEEEDIKDTITLSGDFADVNNQKLFKVLFTYIFINFRKFGCQT